MVRSVNSVTGAKGMSIVRSIFSEKQESPLFPDDFPIVTGGSVNSSLRKVSKPLCKACLRKATVLRVNRERQPIAGKVGSAKFISSEELFHNVVRLRRSELPTTDNELKLIAALAQMGLIRIPKNGYKIPAATGMLTTL